jgi:cell division protein FtsQ
MQEYRNEEALRPYRTAAVRYRKRKTMNLYATVAVAVVAAVGALLCVNVFFRLNSSDVRVSGATLYSAEQICYVGGISDGQNLIRLNTDFVEKRIKENLVYIDDVKVEKSYPDKLVITVTQATEEAQLENNGLYCTVSKSGRVLENALSQRSEELPLVVGFELKDDTAGVKAQSEDSQKTQIFGDIFDELEALSFDKITEIDLSDRTDIKLFYDGRIEIDLGSSVDMDIKLSYMKSVIDSGLPESYEGTLRYNGVESGISAIPKQNKVTAVDSSQTDSTQSDSDSDSAQQTYGEYTESTADGYDDSTQTYDGYSDSTAYDDGTYDYGTYDYGTYGDDTYDYGTYDYGTDYSADGYTSTDGYSEW